MQLRRTSCPTRLRAHAGYTLTETLVAIVVALLAVAATLSFNRFQLFAMRNQVNQLDLQTNARNFLDLFAREVRRAGQDPSCAKTFGALAEAGHWRIRLQSDFDGDGALTGTNEDITYAYNYWYDRIERTANGTTSILINGVNVYDCSLRYFDAAGNELYPSGWFETLASAQRAQVRKVRLEVALTGPDVDPLNPSTLRARLSTDVDLRNRFFISSTACP
jgi:type II secretory pathway pseudopilin PulG